MNLNGKTALITGASRGIGRAIAIELARQGVQRLILVARDGHRLEEVAEEIRPCGVEVVVLPLDLSDSSAVNVAIACTWRDCGPIHLLVNCAGVAYQAPFIKSRLPQMQNEISVNLMGLYLVTRLVARRMATRREGHIVNVSSVMGKIAAPTMATYSATKFAILGFTQALRGELAPYNVRVSALLPSLTDTDMVRHFRWFRWVIPSTPEQVARSLIGGLQSNRPEILVDWQSRMALWCYRIAPGLIEKLVHGAAPETRPRPRLRQRSLRRLFKSPLPVQDS